MDKQLADKDATIKDLREKMADQKKANREMEADFKAVRFFFCVCYVPFFKQKENENEKNNKIKTKHKNKMPK